MINHQISKKAETWASFCAFVRRGLGGLILLPLASACVPHRPYWLEPEPGVAWKNTSKQLEMNKAGEMLAKGTQGEPPLCIVEFDDHGEFWSGRQEQAVERMLKAKKGGKPPLVILFAHGWKNNADPKCGDLESFKKLLRELEQEQVLTRQFNVCGIYVGWRGDVTPRKVEYTGVGFVARQLTIYNRMDAADRLANGLPFTRFLSKVAQLSMQESGGKCVMIGHSLGARILENTITRSLVENYGLASDRSGNRGSIALKKPADLVLLINPASDALRVRQTLMSVQWSPLSEQRLIKGDGSLGDRYHVPLIISLRSETDTATGNIYTAAMKLGKWGRKTRMYPVSNGSEDHRQKEYITQTGPTLAHLLSHQVQEIKKPVELAVKPLDYNLHQATQNRFLLTHEGQAKQWYQIVPDTQGSFKVYAPEDETRRGSYWVMQVPPKVLNGHSGQGHLNGIFSDSMIDLFAALYRISIPATSPQAQADASEQLRRQRRSQPEVGTSPRPFSKTASVPLMATPKQMMQPLRVLTPDEKLPQAPPPVPQLPPPAAAPNP
jgi:hypothetical protein